MNFSSHNTLMLNLKGVNLSQNANFIYKKPRRGNDLRQKFVSDVKYSLWPLTAR